jgi:hypothetical protein
MNSVGKLIPMSIPSLPHYDFHRRNGLAESKPTQNPCHPFVCKTLVFTVPEERTTRYRSHVIETNLK